MSLVSDNFSYTPCQVTILEEVGNKDITTLKLAVLLCAGVEKYLTPIPVPHNAFYRAVLSVELRTCFRSTYAMCSGLRNLICQVCSINCHYFCLDVRGGDYQNGSVLYCVLKVVHSHKHT